MKRIAKWICILSLFIVALYFACVYATGYAIRYGLKNIDRYVKQSLASSSVCVSYLKSNIKGADMQPSIAFSRLISLLGEDNVKDTSSLLPIDRIYTEKNATEYIGSYDNDISVAIKEYFGFENQTQGGFKNDTLSISEETAKEIFGNHISISKSSIETFASCKMKYYCNYVLRLKPSKRIYFEANNIGTLNHLIIEKFFDMQKNESFDASRLSDNDIVLHLLQFHTSVFRTIPIYRHQVLPRSVKHAIPVWCR